MTAWAGAAEVTGEPAGDAEFEPADETAGEDAYAAAVGDLAQALQFCRGLASDTQRLACFDQLARDNAPPAFQGRLGFRSPLFTVEQATRLRYRSQGVIFVLYVLNEGGEVLQNLHLGGGGEGVYDIKESGRYSLQIDGSASWQVWLDPLESVATLNQ